MSWARSGLGSAFVRNVVTLMTGTGLAQVVPIVAAPILSRLYDPSDYGILTLYSTVSGLVALGATGMYAHAIILARDEKEAANVLGLSFLVTLGVSLGSVVVFSLFGPTLARLLREPAMVPWIYLAPLSVFLAGLLQTLDSWSNRKRQYKRLASSRIAGSLAGTGSQLGLGGVDAGSGGLIAGVLAGQAVTAGMLGWQARRQGGTSWRSTSRAGIVQQARYHRRFPLYVLPAEFINVLTNRVPVFLLSVFATTADIGSYGFALRILGVPTALLASSVTDVFRVRASDDYLRYGSCRDIFVRTLISLSLLSVLPFSIVFALGPWLFAVIFGDAWREAGEYARWLSIMYFFRFVSSPLSYVYFVAGKQREDFWLHLYMAVSTIASMFLGYVLFDEIIGMIILFSVNYSFIYIIYLVRSYTFSGGQLQRA